MHEDDNNARGYVMLERSECITQPRALLHQCTTIKTRWLAKRVIKVLLLIKKLKTCLKLVELDLVSELKKAS